MCIELHQYPVYLCDKQWFVTEIESLSQTFVLNRNHLILLEVAINLYTQTIIIGFLSCLYVQFVYYGMCFYLFNGMNHL